MVRVINELGPTPKGSNVVTSLNVVILAVLLAVLALGLFTKSASAHKIGVHSVDTSKAPDEIRMGSMAIDYTDARNYGISQWRLRAPVAIKWVVSGGLPPTVVWAQDNSARADTKVGIWFGSSASDDMIYFYSENINQFNFDFEDKRWIGTHELGHALNINHSDGDVGPANAVMYSYRYSGSPNPYYPVGHDDYDYNLYW